MCQCGGSGAEHPSFGRTCWANVALRFAQYCADVCVGKALLSLCTTRVPSLVVQRSDLSLWACVGWTLFILISADVSILEALLDNDDTMHSLWEW